MTEEGIFNIQYLQQQNLRIGRFHDEILSQIQCEFWESKISSDEQFCEFLYVQKQMITEGNFIKKKKSAHRRKGISQMGNKSKKKQNESQVHEDLLHRFRKFILVESFKTINQHFKSLYGRHTPISYDPKYGFNEQWQISKKEKEVEELKGKKIYLAYAILLTIMLNVCLWSLSVAICFDLDYVWISTLIIGLNMFEMVMVWNKRALIPVAKQKLVKFSKELLCIIFCIIEISISSLNLKDLKITLAVCISVHLYFKAAQRYKDIKIFHLTSAYRDFVNLFDLFLLLITITHIFALALYLVGMAQEQNWLVKMEIQHTKWTTKYIYSLYFSSSTLLTVGYGDVTPTNVYEILMILVTQIIGIATFAYAVNQIGVALSSMQEKKQKTQKDLNNVEIMGNTYRLDPEIVSQMRTQLINNQEVSETLCVEEENQLCLKFSDHLREQIQVESSMRVLKRSAYVLMNWTGMLQAKIASKLVKHIYAAEQPLLQVPGSEKMYLIDQGRVDILNNARQGFKVCFQRILKSLSIKKSTQIVVDNIFGYTSIVSDRPFRLMAICKGSCICYIVTKNDFLQCLANCEEDLEKYHELKEKVNLAKIPQEIEAPLISTIRQHYNPSVFYLIAKEKGQKEKLNIRKRFFRENKKTPLMVNRKDKQTLKLIESHSLKKSRNYLVKKNKETMNSVDDIFNSCDENSDGEEDFNFQKFFESEKEYRRYFQKRNIQRVVERVRNVNYMGKVLAHP